MDLAAPLEHANAPRDMPDPKTLSPSVPAQLPPPQRAQEGKGFLNTELSAAGAEQPRGGQRAHARLLNCCCGSCEAGGLTLRWPTLGSCPTEAPAALQQLDPPVGLGGCMRPPTQPHGPPGCRDAYGTGTSG